MKDIPDYKMAELIRSLIDVRQSLIVEAGALDGISGSAGYVLEAQHCAKCINLEPNIHAFNKLQKVRRRSINLNIGLGDSKDTTVVYLPNDGPLGDMPARASMILDRDYWQTVEGRTTKEVSFQVDTWSNIMNSLNLADAKVSVLILDVEGYELNAIKGIQGTSYIPDLVVVETDKVPQLAVAEVLRGIANYTYVGEFMGNSFFKISRTSWFNFLQFKMKIIQFGFTPRLKILIKTILVAFGMRSPNK